MSVQILTGDCRDLLRAMPEKSVQCCVTSPPYFGLRDYGTAEQIGLEASPAAFVAELVAVFEEVRRVLKDDGTLWLNLGDSYARAGGTDRKVSETAKVGSTRNTMRQMGDRTSQAPDGLKPKDMIGIPWRVAFALQDAGWYLRQDIIWHKPNPMPESVTDRCTKAHEYVFLLSKSERYFFDNEAIKEPSNPSHFRKTRSLRKDERGLSADNGFAHGREFPTRNMRSVWTITTKAFKQAHFATFPPELPEICIKAGSRPGDTVLDPFGGAGTTALVADRLGREAILCELNPDYVEIARQRITGESSLLAEVTA